MMSKTYNSKLIIADTSCLILLSKVEELELLKKLFKEIIITSEIVEEYGEPLPNWFVVKSVVDRQKQIIFESQVDKGEASAIALSFEIDNTLVILDDNKARKLAKKLEIAFIETLSILIYAKLEGVISSIKPILEKIQQTNFRISEELLNAALREAKEK